MSTKTYFYPTTAEVLVDLGYPSPAPNGVPHAPDAPSNTMGGFGNGFDIHDYNGDRGGANIFQPLNPTDPVPSANVKDTLNPFWPWHSTNVSSWYLMRRTVFKNWTIAGIFTRNMDFLVEADVDCVYANGGFRDEAPNSSLGSGFVTLNPYEASTLYTDAQGCGFAMKVVVGGLTKAIAKIQGSNSSSSPDVLTAARQTLSLALPNLSPTDLTTLEVHIITEQFSNVSTASGVHYPHPKVETQLYRLGLAADPLAMRSSGKASAALTSR